MSADVVRIRYPAFLSYCHRDMAFARRLHRRLEGYGLPRRLVGRPGPRGPVPARLSPIFRDREELSAADDLSAEVRAALAASGALVVVCSPGAAASPWVAREIETFRALHPDRPVLAVLAEGEPGEAFPAPLTAAGAEPLAADFRKGRDGAALGFLKLVSGIAGVGLDELIQRDAQRRLRAVTAVTVGAVAVMLAMGGLAAFAVQARAEAERRRADAEGLVEFMLTDLRAKLKGVGRLSIMEAVNSRALKIYEARDASKMSSTDLKYKANILRAVGDDEINLGHLNLAWRKYQEASNITRRLEARFPQNPEVIFENAQSQFGLAYILLLQGRLADAKAGFLTYLGSAKRMLALAPGNPKYLKELAYSEGTLCAVALKRPQEAADALAHCRAALDGMTEAARKSGLSPELQADLAQRHAWLADAYWASGDRVRCREQRLLQQEILRRLVKSNPSDADLRDAWLSLQRSLAWLEAADGQVGLARSRLLEAVTLADQLLKIDPENKIWAQKRDAMKRELQKLG